MTQTSAQWRRRICVMYYYSHPRSSGERRSRITRRYYHTQGKSVGRPPDRPHLDPSVDSLHGPPLNPAMTCRNQHSAVREASWRPISSVMVTVYTSRMTFLHPGRTAGCLAFTCHAMLFVFSRTSIVHYEAIHEGLRTRPDFPALPEFLPPFAARVRGSRESPDRQRRSPSGLNNW